MDAYAEFLARKALIDPPTGLEHVPDLPSVMFPFQRDICAWALRRGRAALFAGTGLGKSLMELAWANAVADATGGMVLILAPLAVATQLVREAEKFGLPARLVRSQADCGPGVNVTNYQKIEHFDVGAFNGVVLDESSILKSTDGHYRSRLIEECARVPFRLAATATPAPNDFMELGNHAEFLGVMSYTDMLATFFVHDGGDTRAWRLKGHAEADFWRWMASWSVMLRSPADLGYDGAAYVLPELKQVQHIVALDSAPPEGSMFHVPAGTMAERLSARRESVAERVAKASNAVLNSICDMLEVCPGSLNTQSADETSINQTHQKESGGSLKVEDRQKTQITCGIITPPIQSASSGQPSSRPNSTGDVASDTQTTPNTETGASKRQGADPPTLAGRAALNPSMAWTPPNTTGLSPNKEAGAPSAEISRSEISSLITAIQAAKSEGFFAAPAIPASVISKMTQSGLIEPWCIWCNLNSEQDALAKALGPLAYSVSGSMSDEDKEVAILAWCAGERPIMISKPSIMGFGMNFQHCRNTLFVGLNDSFEQVYQAVRRFWRFGQTKPVTAHFIVAETEGAVIANLRRKEADADRMAGAMVRHTADLSSQAVRGMVRDRPNYAPTQPVIIPSWLGRAA